MEHYKETAATWNKVATLYEEKFMDFTIYDESYDFLCSQIVHPNANVLEVGCGPGMIAKYLLEKLPDLQILGTDAAPNMVELAQKNNPKGKFIQLDCREILSLDQQFDIILSGFCIPYLSDEDVTRFLSDSHGILNQNGLLYLSFVPGNAEKSGYQTGSSGDRVYFYYHSEDVIREKLKTFGFEFLKRFCISYERTTREKEVHLVLIASKR